MFLNRKVDLTVVHEDACLVAVNKPAGLPSVPGRAPAWQDCVTRRLASRFDNLHVVHRLDIATSGLLVLARGADAQRLLSHAFATRRVDKTYVAEVHGIVARDEGTIELPLAADWLRRPRQKVDLEGGKAAVTRYRVLQRDTATQTTRLKLEPLTGRSHQLRVHLQALGHPIVGDTLYGPEALGADDAALTSARLQAMRLHAQTLALPDLTYFMTTSSPPAWTTCRRATDMSQLLDACTQRLTLHSEEP